LADRFFIANYYGASHVGVYSLSFQIAQSTNVVSNAINQAMVPLLFEKLAAPKPEWLKIRRLTIVYGSVLILFSVLFLIIFKLASPYVIGNEYKDSSYYVPWLTLSFFLLAASRIAANYLMYYRKTGVLAMLTILSSLISVALNVIYIPEYGIIAACWASIVAFSFLLFASCWCALKCRN
jgi:O-antigen/teichoic acid export membrane protein